MRLLSGVLVAGQLIAFALGAAADDAGTSGSGSVVESGLAVFDSGQTPRHGRREPT